MARFQLHAQLVLRPPTNIAAVRQQIQGGLQGINIPVNVQVPQQAAAQLQKVNTQVGQTAAVANKAATNMKSFSESILLATKRYAAFVVGTTVIFRFIGAITQSIGEAIRFDREMVRIRQITGQTADTIGLLSDEISNLAIQWGVASSELANVSRLLTQSGLASREASVALQAIAKTDLAPTFENMAKTAEGAIAILGQFGEEAGENQIKVEGLEGALGSINAVSKNFAVESGDLISVVRRAGGVFAATGGSLEELIALFTAARATTRESAESIATGIRTITTRLQRASSARALEKIGVNLRDETGEFIGTFEAFKAISDALDARGIETTSKAFAELGERIAGFRQISRFIPLVDRFEKAQEALAVANKGQTSLAEDAETAQEALAIQIAKVREEFAALVREIVASDAFRSIVKTTLELASAFIKVADALQPLLPLLTAFTVLKTAQLATGIVRSVGTVFPRLAEGGRVPGSGNFDTVPAMLTPGEFVISKDVVNAVGIDRLDRWHRGGYKDQVQRFAKGGVVRSGRRNYGVFDFSDPMAGTRVIRQPNILDKELLDNFKRQLDIAGKGLKNISEEINEIVRARRTQGRQQLLPLSTTIPGGTQQTFGFAQPAQTGSFGPARQLPLPFGGSQPLVSRKLERQLELTLGGSAAKGLAQQRGALAPRVIPGQITTQRVQKDLLEQEKRLTQSYKETVVANSQNMAQRRGLAQAQQSLTRKIFEEARAAGQSISRRQARNRATAELTRDIDIGQRGFVGAGAQALGRGVRQAPGAIGRGLLAAPGALRRAPGVIGGGIASVGRTIRGGPSGGGLGGLGTALRSREGLIFGGALGASLVAPTIAGAVTRDERRQETISRTIGAGAGTAATVGFLGGGPLGAAVAGTVVGLKSLTDSLIEEADNIRRENISNALKEIAGTLTDEGKSTAETFTAFDKPARELLDDFETLVSGARTAPGTGRGARRFGGFVSELGERQVSNVFDRDRTLGQRLGVYLEGLTGGLSRRTGLSERLGVTEAQTVTPGTIADVALTGIRGEEREKLAEQVEELRPEFDRLLKEAANSGQSLGEFSDRTRNYVQLLFALELATAEDIEETFNLAKEKGAFAKALVDSSSILIAALGESATKARDLVDLRGDIRLSTGAIQFPDFSGIEKLGSEAFIDALQRAVLPAEAKLAALDINKLTAVLPKLLVGKPFDFGEKADPLIKQLGDRLEPLNLQDDLVLQKIEEQFETDLVGKSIDEFNKALSPKKLQSTVNSLLSAFSGEEASIIAATKAQETLSAAIIKQTNIITQQRERFAEQAFQAEGARVGLRRQRAEFGLGPQIRAGLDDRNVLRRVATLTGGETDVSALGERLGFLQAEFDNAAEGIRKAQLQIQIQQTVKAIGLLGDTSTRTADLVTALGKAERERAGNIGLKEKLLGATPEEQQQILGRQVLTGKAVREGITPEQFRQANQAFQRNLIEGLRESASQVVREGRFKGLTRGQVADELLEPTGQFSDASTRAGRRVRRRREEILDIGEEGVQAQQVLASQEAALLRSAEQQGQQFAEQAGVRFADFLEPKNLKPLAESFDLTEKLPDFEAIKLTIDPKEFSKIEAAQIKAQQELDRPKTRQEQLSGERLARSHMAERQQRLLGDEPTMGQRLQQQIAGRIPELTMGQRLQQQVNERNQRILEQVDFHRTSDPFFADTLPDIETGVPGISDVSPRRRFFDEQQRRLPTMGQRLQRQIDERLDSGGISSERRPGIRDMPGFQASRGQPEVQAQRLLAENEAEILHQLSTNMRDFITASNALSETLAPGSIPNEIAVKHSDQRVEVILNGAQVLAEISPEIQTLIVRQTKDAMNQMLKQKFPNVGEFNPQEPKV
jgi:TP901 family phage tail tape measure protein